MNSFDEISNVLQKNNNFLITSHINLDGDAIGSELALYSILKKLKKKPIILNQGKLPKIYDFLPGVNKVQYLEDDYIDTKNIDVGIALDCSNCLLYTSDAADEEDSVDLGGRRIIKKKKKIKN